MPDMKSGSWACILLVLCMTAVCAAADIAWNNNASDGNWNTPSNWSTGAVPTTSTSDRAVIPIAAGPVFSEGRSATTYRVLLWKTNGTLTMSGGSLTTNNYFDVGNTAADSGTLIVESGTLTMSGASGHFFCGRAGTAAVNMSGGAVNVGGTFYVARDATASASISLAGGTITCNSLSIGLNGGSGLINITSSGTVIINGDARTTVNTYISAGKIKAYNGAGQVLVDYNVTNAGKTTIKASEPQKAGAPSPANNATNVSVLTNLSWTGIVPALSHDVYLGTASPPTLQGNVTLPTFDPGRLQPSTHYYWRIDEVTESGTSAGDVWSFTTGSLTASAPNPANDAANVDVTAQLSWTGGASASSYNVFFDTSNPPASVGNQTAVTYNPGALSTDTTYYWRVDAVEGETVYEGPVWSFATKASFRKGPYLIYPGSNAQMTVLWQVADTVAGSIAWGTDTTYSTGSAATTEYGADHQHKYTITDLTPGTKYYYRVTAGAAQASGSFRTAPASDAQGVKFLVYGDTRSNANLHASVCQGMMNTIGLEPEYQTMLLHTGDWVNAADSESDWTSQFFVRSYPEMLQLQGSLPILGTIGNHEETGSLFKKYYPYPYVTTRLYWSFDYGLAHIAFLDQFTDYSAGSAQLTWLENDLANSDKKWKFIILHQNGWSAGGSHPNDTNVQTYIQPLAEQYGVQVVFGGHNHYYARAVVNGIHHVTAGGGGAPLYNPVGGQPNIVLYEKTLEFSKVSIDANSLTVESLRPDGSVIDVFYSEQEEPEFTFIQATDPQMTFCENSLVNWEQTIRKLNVCNPAFAVVTGDLLNSPGSQLQADMYFGAKADLKPAIPLYQLAGNHDVHDAPSSTSYGWYQQHFGDLWYSFTYGNNLFISLESNILRDATNYPGKDVEQINWLTDTLASATGYDNIIVFMHHPLCVSSVSEPDAWNNMPTARRAQLLSLFHQYGVRAVLTGHWHQNGYVRDGDLEIIITSSTTCPLAADPPGFRIVKVFKNHIEHTYKCLDCIYSTPCDFTGDGICDIEDLEVFNENWLKSGIWP
ncbi:MAG: metallophosphoesterase [Planctomycetaceae bacterium]|nr:metallophosphoesterase [Planctomycetaceae bacterium]